jgi:phytoene synthase
MTMMSPRTPTVGAPDVRLEASYERCRVLHRFHGRSYYLATRLLPRWKRRHVHALYGFTRTTDEIVDQLSCGPPDERARRLAAWGDAFAAALAGEPTDDPVLPAVVDTIHRFRLAPDDFDAFLRSMAMDLTVTRYRTYDDLLGYMAGSAAAIGTMMLPILGAPDLDRAHEPARQLGLAFQLTNFIRDVGEDLDRGRVYLPMADLEAHGVTVADLYARVATDPVRALVAFEVERAREHYRLAAPGIAALDRSSQRCIRAAYELYGGILDEVVMAGHDVFTRRATVASRRRLAIAAACLLGPANRPLRLPGGRPVS